MKRKMPKPTKSALSRAAATRTPGRSMTVIQTLWYQGQVADGVVLAHVKTRHAGGVDDGDGTGHGAEAGRIDELGVETGGAGRAFGEERHERAAAASRGLCETMAAIPLS